jgi:copper/silver efflux system protein
MIERIIEWSLRNRFLTLALVVAFGAWGWFSLERTPIDAIPDLSENQVIVFADWMGRSPQEVEDQITYPLSTTLQGLAGVKAVRSTSEFNYSMINVIFDDSVDFYFARNRVLERLTTVGSSLPGGVVPYLAPDATALGQIFWYTVEGDGRDLGELRAIQDWYVRYQLVSVSGVVQVASVGGMPREWQVDVDPERLRGYGVTLGDLYSAIARSNSSVGGRVLHKANAEFLVRGIGWIKDARDIEDTVVTSRDGTPVRVKDVAAVQLGTEFRRSVLEKDGKEAVGGVVMMRYGENPLAVTKAVHEKIRELSPGLPEGVRVVPFYERTRLITEAVDTVSHTVVEEMIVASLIILLVMRHVGASLVVCVTLPLAVLGAFILMRHLAVPSNIMSLSGIAISIGVLVDQAIVLTDNAMHHLREKFGDEKVKGDVAELLVGPCKEVGRPIFFAIIIMVISFLPVFALGGLEGKMFHPLAFTKGFALLAVGLLTITLLPAILPVVLKGRMPAEEESWLVRSVVVIYRPVLAWLMDRHRGVILAFAVILGTGWVLKGHLGTEFMPPLDEGSILDMPVTAPRASVTQVADDLKARDALLRAFPEVEQVVGKAGRADTPTDPSPLDMVETMVNLHPRDHWPRRHLDFDDATAETREVLDVLVARGVVKPQTRDDAQTLANDATMFAVESFDATTRSFSLARRREWTPELSRSLTAVGVKRTVDFLRSESRLEREPTQGEIDALVGKLEPVHGPRLTEVPSTADVASLVRDAAQGVVEIGAAKARVDLLVETHGGVASFIRGVAETVAGRRADLVERVRDDVARARNEFLEEKNRALRWELDAMARPAYPVAAAEALVHAARDHGALAREPADGELAEVRRAREPDFHPFLRVKTKPELLQEIDSAIRVPGWANIWTQPIINRIDMLATGVRTMIGVKVFGKDLDEIQTVSEDVASVLREIKGAVDVFPEQSTGEGYVEVRIDRAKAARYGVNVGDVQDVVEIAVGGKAITQTVQGRERYPVRVRYSRDARVDEESLRRTLVAAPGAMSADGGAAMPEAAAPAAVGGAGMGGGMGGGAASAPAPRAAAAPAGFTAPLQVPLAEVADVRVVEGPSMVKSENGMLRNFVQLNVRDRDIVGFVEEAKRAVEERVKIPAGMHLEWSGQFEHQVRARRTIQIVFPMVIVLIFVILYVTYHDFAHACLMMLAVPGALAGGVIFQAIFGFNFSVAVWVGYIACFGMATETGIVMLVYLREAVARAGGHANIPTTERLREIVVDGAVRRLRPKLLTEGTTIIGLAPMLWATGTGAEVIRPMAAPVLGGILMADEVIDVFLPVLFYWVEKRRWRRAHPEAQ